MWAALLRRRAAQWAFGGTGRTAQAGVLRGGAVRWAVGGVAVGGGLSIASPPSCVAPTSAQCDGQSGCLPGDPLGAIMVTRGWYRGGIRQAGAGGRRTS